MSRTPKEKFLTSPHRYEFEQMAMTPTFEAALDYALLEMQLQLPEVVDPARGWDCHSRMLGARQFAEILKGLHVPADKSAQPRVTNLNYEAGV